MNTTIIESDRKSYARYRFEQFQNLSDVGYTGNAFDDYEQHVVEAIRDAYRSYDERILPLSGLVSDRVDWRYLLHVCDLLDDEYR